MGANRRPLWLSPWALSRGGREAPLCHLPPSRGCTARPSWVIFAVSCVWPPQTGPSVPLAARVGFSLPTVQQDIWRTVPDQALPDLGTSGDACRTLGCGRLWVPGQPFVGWLGLPRPRAAPCAATGPRLLLRPRALALCWVAASLMACGSGLSGWLVCVPLWLGPSAASRTLYRERQRAPRTGDGPR